MRMLYLFILSFLFFAQYNAAFARIQDYGFPDKEIVARVGEIDITVDEFVNGYEFSPAFIKRLQDSKASYLKYLIYEKLLALQSINLGFDKQEQPSEMYAAILDDLATEALFKEDILSSVSVSDAEVDTVISQKNIELELKWLYCEHSNEIKKIFGELKKGASFDSIYNQQFNESVFQDMRSLKTSRYNLGKNNPRLANIIDTLQVGMHSLPIHTDDGWYIVLLTNVWNNQIVSEAEYEKLRYESIQAVTKRKMDEASEDYVNHLMTKAAPVIEKDAFEFAQAYIAQFVLPKEKRLGWGLSDVMSSFKEYDNSNTLNKETLVTYSGGIVTVEEFLIWYRNRSEYIKFDKTDFPKYSYSMKQAIWRMIRDELLTALARQKGMYEKPEVIAQAEWWREKIAFSTMYNKLKNMVRIQVEEQPGSYTDQESVENTFNDLMNEKLLREINTMKKKYDIEINEEVLSNIKVSEENNPTAINLYVVKKGGLIPHTPYPTIEHFWNSWE